MQLLAAHTLEDVRPPLWVQAGMLGAALRLDDAGIFHNDLHGGNVLIDDAARRVYLTDYASDLVYTLGHPVAATQTSAGGMLGDLGDFVQQAAVLLFAPLLARIDGGWPAARREAAVETLLAALSSAGPRSGPNRWGEPSASDGLLALAPSAALRRAARAAGCTELADAPAASRAALLPFIRRARTRWGSSQAEVDAWIAAHVPA
jgi:hypothetical protein